MIAVTPFSPNPQMPRAKEIVADLRVTSPELEARTVHGKSPRVSAEHLKEALSSVLPQSKPAGNPLLVRPEFVSPRSDRPARGRVCTLGRVTPAAARRATSAPSPTVTPSDAAALSPPLEEAGSDAPAPLASSDDMQGGSPVPAADAAGQQPSFSSSLLAGNLHVHTYGDAADLLGVTAACNGTLQLQGHPWIFRVGAQRAPLSALSILHQDLC
jgi:hypothetical protein